VIRYLLPAEGKGLRNALQKNVDECGPKNDRLKKHLQASHLRTGCSSWNGGMRKSEQYNLTWPDINFEERELIARDTKSGTDRRVHLIDVIAALQALKALNFNKKAERLNRSTSPLLTRFARLATTRNGGLKP
jgi:integrase